MLLTFRHLLRALRRLTIDVKSLAGLCLDPFATDERLVLEQVWVVKLGDVSIVQSKE